MRVSSAMLTIFAAAAAGLPNMAIAQERSSVDEYLCTFAGKCGDTAATEEVMAAPATKGFSLARPQQDTMAAPDTRGFSLARPKGVSAARPKGAAVAAPATRGFSVRRAAGAKPVARPAARTAARARPAGAVVSRALPAAPRADLMLSFEYNSAQMTAPAMDRAKVFAQALNTPELQGRRFVIEGHTDSFGGRAKNRDLSQRRAQSVADFLIAQGVDRTRLEVQGLGFDRPLPGKAARAEENRRVEAALIS